MVEYFSYIKGLKSQEKPDYIRLYKLLRSMLVSGNPNKLFRYDWMEKAAKHLETINKKEASISQGGKPGTAPTQENSVDNEKRQAGFIDIDKDRNFEAPDDSLEQDDESNIDESNRLEVLDDMQDALPLSIKRIQESSQVNFMESVKLNSQKHTKTPKPTNLFTREL